MNMSNAASSESPRSELTSSIEEEVFGMDSEVFNKEYTVDFVDHWDDLINWKGRAKAESGFFQDILKKAGAKDVADVACGTGYHAIDLAKSGFCLLYTSPSPRD